VDILDSRSEISGIFEMCCYRKMKNNCPYRVRNEEVLPGVKDERNILQKLNRRKANWIGHILHRNCFLKHVIEGKVEGRIKIMKRRGRRCTHLQDDLRQARGFRKLKGESLDRTLWRTCCGREHGPVVRQTTE